MWYTKIWCHLIHFLVPKIIFLGWVTHVRAYLHCIVIMVYVFFHHQKATTTTSTAVINTLYSTLILELIILLCYFNHKDEWQTSLESILKAVENFALFGSRCLRARHNCTSRANFQAVDDFLVQSFALIAKDGNAILVAVVLGARKHINSAHLQHCAIVNKVLCFTQQRCFGKYQGNSVDMRLMKNTSSVLFLIEV